LGEIVLSAPQQVRLNCIEHLARGLGAPCHWADELDIKSVRVLEKSRQEALRGAFINFPEA
jgi:hypothetical protein